jgi:hypothetical protein
VGGKQYIRHACRICQRGGKPTPTPAKVPEPELPQEIPHEVPFGEVKLQEEYVPPPAPAMPAFEAPVPAVAPSVVANDISLDFGVTGEAPVDKTIQTKIHLYLTKHPGLKGPLTEHCGGSLVYTEDSLAYLEAMVRNLSLSGVMTVAVLGACRITEDLAEPLGIELRGMADILRDNPELQSCMEEIAVQHHEYAEYLTPEARLITLIVGAGLEANSRARSLN